MAFKFYVLLACLSVSTVSAQLDRAFNFDLNLDNTDNNQVSSTTPVPILRYIDTQNPDGSYTFGYEGGDGTYKIETRYATGEVKGKYGYYDDKGTLREVEYGATPEGGFKPTGSGLDIPDTPPTEDPITSTTTTKNGRKVKLVRRKRPQQQTVNNNRNDPRVQLPASRRRQNVPTSATSEVINRRLPIRGQPQNTNNQFSNFQPQPLTLNTRPQQQQQRPTQPRQPVARPQPRQLQPQPQQFAAQPFQVPANRFDGHPAQNIDLNTGSYTISYGR
jgi:hypothetical protein